MTRDEILKKSILMNGFNEQELKEILQILSVSEVNYVKNQILFNMDDYIDFFGIVISGNIQVATNDINGDKMIMANVNQGETFAESMALTSVKKSPVYAIAIRDSIVAWIKIEPVRNAYMSSNTLLKRLGENFTKSLALRALSMNNRIQILSKKTIREKVIAFLSFQVQSAIQAQSLGINADKKNTEIAVPFDRNDMADYLGTDRSALSRVLSQMAEEGIIEFKKNTFIILVKYLDVT